MVLALVGGGSGRWWWGVGLVDADVDVRCGVDGCYWRWQCFVAVLVVVRPVLTSSER